MNAVLSSNPSPSGRRTQSRHRTGFTSLLAASRSKVLVAAIAAVSISLAAASPSRAGDTDKAAEIGKTALNIIGNASKTVDKITKGAELLNMLKTAKNPCGCSKKVIRAIYVPFKNGNSDSKGNGYAEAIAGCFGFRGFGSAQHEKLVDAVRELWGRMAKNRYKSILFLRKIESERRAECAKKKTVNQTAFYYDPADRENSGTLLAGLEGYTLPGSEPLAAGDLDGDGLTDLVVADSDTDTLVVLLAIPGDGFEVAQTLSAGLQPAFVFIDDVDEDGFLDVVVLNRGSADGSLFLGNGDGTVGDEEIFDAVRGGQSTVETDVDGDAKADRVSVTEAPGHVSVGFGALDGPHGTFLDYPAGGTADAVLPLDVDLDGVTDLIVHNQGSSEVSVLPGNGDGSFREPRVFTYDLEGKLVETPDQVTIGTPSVSIEPVNTNGVTFVPAPNPVNPARVSPSLLLGQ